MSHINFVNNIRRSVYTRCSNILLDSYCFVDHIEIKVELTSCKGNRHLNRWQVNGNQQEYVYFVNVGQDINRDVVEEQR